MVSFRLSYHSLPSASPSSELRNSRTVKRNHDDFNSVLADWVCIYLSHIFTIRNALWYTKLSLIYKVNCLNRGTDLNRLLISLSQNTKMQNKNMRDIWALWHVEKCLNITKHCILVSTSLCYLNTFIVMNKIYKTKQGRTQGGLGDWGWHPPPSAWYFTKSSLPAQRRLTVFADFLIVNLST